MAKPARADLDANLDYARSLARGVGGALLFAFPLLMTMEMWQLGFAAERWRLIALLIASLPMLVGLSYLVGFEPTFRLRDEVLDSLAALGIGILLAAGALSLFGVLHLSHSPAETLGKIALCAVPGAIGALLAGKQFQVRDTARSGPRDRSGYAGELFTMSVGALFLAFNVAPTEEMILIAFQMTTWQSAALMTLSLGLLLVTIQAVGLPGRDEARRRHPAHTFLAFALPGYGIAILLSVFVLWVFGRFDGMSATVAANMVIVLGFPAAMGCATARLVV